MALEFRNVQITLSEHVKATNRWRTNKNSKGNNKTQDDTYNDKTFVHAKNDSSLDKNEML